MSAGVPCTSACMAILTAGLALISPATGEVTLVRNGQPQAAIVVAAEPTRAAQLAAFELREHLRLITGAELPLAPEGAPVDGLAIFVGDTTAARNAGLTQDAFAEQEYVIRVRDDVILLVGRDDPDTGAVTYDPESEIYDGLPGFWDERGTLNAAYDFLERCCDVRWFAATEYGTVFPQSTSLTLEARDIRRTPAFEYRDGLAAGGDNVDFYEAMTGYWPRNSEELREWRTAAHADLKARYPQDGRFARARRQRVRLHVARRRHGGKLQRCNHSLYGYYKRFWDDPDTRRPELFSKGYEGKPPQLCYTSRALIEQVAADAREYYDTGQANDIFWKPRPPNWFPVEPNDNKSFCKCDACQALLKDDPDADQHYSNGQHSDYFFHFVNEVARELRKTHPERSVVTLAYMSHAKVPGRVELDPSVAVQFCQPSNRQPANHDNYLYELELLRQWAEDGSGRPLYMWLYNTFPIEFARKRNLHCWPGVFSHTLASQMKRYAALGVRGFFHCGLAQDVDDYLTFRAMDNPGLDVNQELTEYFDGLYGAAAPPIRTFYQRVEKRYGEHGNGLSDLKADDPQYTDTRMAELAGLVSRADSLAKTERERANLRLFKLGIWRYMQEGMTQRRRLQSAPVPAIDVPRVQPARGDMSKVAWDRACDMGPWHQNNSLDRTERALSGRIAHDGTYLYLELTDTCDTTVLQSTGLIFPYDTWEVFVSDDAGLPVRQYAFNPAGTMIGLSHGEVNFRMNVQMDDPPMAVHSDISRADRWISRLAWPLDRITQAGLKPGDSFHLNVARVWKLPPLRIAIWGPLTVLKDMSRAPVLTLEEDTP